MTVHGVRCSCSIDLLIAQYVFCFTETQRHGADKKTCQANRKIRLRNWKKNYQFQYGFGQLLWVLTRFVSYDVELFCAGCARQSEKALSNWVCNAIVTFNERARTRLTHVMYVFYWFICLHFCQYHLDAVFIHSVSVRSLSFSRRHSISFSHSTLAWDSHTQALSFKECLSIFMPLLRSSRIMKHASKTLQGWTQSHFCKHYLLKEKCAFCFPYESFAVFSIYKLLVLFFVAAHVIVIFAWERVHIVRSFFFFSSH